MSIPTIQLENPIGLEPLTTSEGLNSKDVIEPNGTFGPIPAPYPHRLSGPNKFCNNTEVYEVFKQVKINIPLLDVIKQIPMYAKFLKDLCIAKRKKNVL